MPRMNFDKAAKIMKDILGLISEPIADKFLEDKGEVNDFKMPGERRYCQVLVSAREGQKLIVTADNIACPAAAWALGFREPSAKLSSGEMPARMGIFESPADPGQAVLR
ncbi:MAG: DUF169 domain-containing protein [Dehalococcoidales bacterium]|nr:DUF169 domain-containing protein [Dehalococcoidales bacterium]